MVLHRAQRPLLVEAAAQDHRRGGRQADDEVEEAPGVKERRRDHHRLAGAVGDLVDQRRHRQQPVGAGALRPLRRPGGAGGEDDEARFVGRRLQVGVVAGGDQRVERLLLRLAVGPADDARDALVDAVEQAGELLVVDQRLRPLAPHHLDQLRPGEHRVEVERAGPELGGGKGRLDEAAVVAAHDPDAVSRPDPHLGEGVGEGVGAAVHALEGERAAFVDQHRLVRVFVRRGGDAGRRRGSPAQEGRDDLGGPVGPRGADDPRLAQDLRLEGRVGDRLAHARSYGTESSHRTGKVIRYRPRPRRCRRSPRRARSSPCPRWSSP